jgi:Chaperone of endosialidase
MTQAYQLAIGSNIPLTINQAPSDIALANPSFLKIQGGANGNVLGTDGAGDLSWLPGGGTPEAPNDGTLYGRKNLAWSAAAPEAPNDGQLYARQSLAWHVTPAVPAPSSTPPAMDGTAAVGTSALFARGDHVHPTDTSRAPLASPALTGTPTAPTATAGTSTTQLATTAFVTGAITGSVAGVASWNTRTGAVTMTLADITGIGGAPIDSPAFTGTPIAPSPPNGDNSANIATTAWVIANAAVGSVPLPATSSPQMDGPAAIVGTATTYARADHVHPSDISKAPLASPTFTGTPAAPTPLAADNSTKLATTAYVTSALAALPQGGVVSFNTRTGAVTLTTADVTGAGGAPLVSPALTGTPTAPTPAPADNSTKLATTAYVTSAMAAGVTSFNTRTGAITLSAADITGAGGALLASPTFTGTPAAPTPAPGTNNTALATTAFVAAAVAGAKTTTSATAPATPNVGDLWYDTVGGQLYIYYNDGNSSQWVVTVNQNLGGLYLSLAGGTLTGNLTVNGTTTLGTATATTPTPTDNSTNIATTAFVKTAVSPSSSTPIMDGTAAVGSSTSFARGDHVHPTDTSRAAQASLANYLPLSGGSISGNLAVSGQGNFGNCYFNNSGYGINTNGTQCYFSGQITIAGAPMYSNNGIYSQGSSGTQIANWSTANGSPSAGWSAAFGCFATAQGVGYAGMGRSDSTSAYIWYFMAGSNNIGNIYTNGSSTAYNTTSDRNMKKNIRDLANAIDVGDIIDRIKPVVFEWKPPAAEFDVVPETAPLSNIGHGFVAQDLYEVVPLAVTPPLPIGPGKRPDDAGPHLWGVDFSKLVPYLVAELQMLRKRVAELEGR